MEKTKENGEGNLKEIKRSPKKFKCKIIIKLKSP